LRRRADQITDSPRPVATICPMTTAAQPWRWTTGRLAERCRCGADVADHPVATRRPEVRCLRCAVRTGLTMNVIKPTAAERQLELVAMR
jgi:hypothetical protein